MDRNKYKIQIPLPPKIDPTVMMMTVEEVGSLRDFQTLNPKPYVFEFLFKHSDVWIGRWSVSVQP